jgi:hypothetical protein
MVGTLPKKIAAYFITALRDRSTQIAARLCFTPLIQLAKNNAKS